MKLMRCPGNLEVTGLVHLKDSGKFLAAGWSKIISSFPDDDDMAVSIGFIMKLLNSPLYTL